jgi:tRNA(His) guanylyltransferase
MKFTSLDAKMRVYETAFDQKVLPELYIVARLDGRGFTRLTKELLNLEKPFDVRFRDVMVQTVQHLMNSGFKVVYGFTQSDEISLLFHLEEKLFERKVPKILSVLAAEASARFSLALGHVAAFDCRLSTLPNANLVVDYFRWRSEDAHRNSLSAYCYWKLREQGETATAATQRLSGASVAEKNEMLFRLGINYNDLPKWQKRGMGFYYETVKKKATNPLNQEEVTISRWTLKTDMDLPIDEEYSNFVAQILNSEPRIP